MQADDLLYLKLWNKKVVFCASKDESYWIWLTLCWITSRCILKRETYNVITQWYIRAILTWYTSELLYKIKINLNCDGWMLTLNRCSECASWIIVKIITMLFFLTWVSSFIKFTGLILVKISGLFWNYCCIFTKFYFYLEVS